MHIDLEAVRRELRERLEKRKGDWPRIASTADISHSWLSQFVRHKIPNPGLETLSRLAAALDAVPATQGGPTDEAPATGPGELAA